MALERMEGGPTTVALVVAEENRILGVRVDGVGVEDEDEDEDAITGDLRK